MAKGLVAILLATAACSSEPATPDGGGMDASTPFDATVLPDSGAPPDAGSEPKDAGFADPATILEGLEEMSSGVNLYLKLRGTLTSTMPPLIFVNTGPSIGHEYLVDPMDFLLPGRLLVFFDLRATGRSGFGTLSSTITNAVTVDAHLEDLENVIEFLDQRTDASKVDLMGHGYGAGVAALYAKRHPDRVSRLVLTAPFPATILQHAYFHAELSARLSTSDRERVLAITREPDCRGNIQQCSLELWNIEGPHYLCEGNLPLWDTMTFRYADFRAGYIYVDRNLRETSYDWTADLAEVSAPTTIISGPCDPIPSDAPALYASQIRGSEHTIIPNTGHFPFVEAPDTYRAVVRRALIYP